MYAIRSYYDCAEAYAKGILNMTANDRAMGSFLFFAYGLGNGAYFPFAVGATTILISRITSYNVCYTKLLRGYRWADFKFEKKQPSLGWKILFKKN